jgi:Rrf2 family protein
MKLSRASNYVVQALVAMVRSKDGNLVASQLTAEAEGIPERFLLKLLLPLVKAGILDSRRGPNGGYRLAKPPEKITLLEIIEAVDAPLRGDAPALGGKDTAVLDRRLQKICERVTQPTRRELGKVTVAQLAKGKGGKKS